MAISPGYLFEFEVLCMEISMALSRNFEKIDCCIAWSKQYFSYIDGKRRFECFIDQEKFQNKVWHYWNMDLTETKKLEHSKIYFYINWFFMSFWVKSISAILILQFVRKTVMITAHKTIILWEEGTVTKGIHVCLMIKLVKCYSLLPGRTYILL